MQEWIAQANLEQEYDLTPSVMSSTDPVKETESQIFFIKHFVKPMLQLTVKAIPEMNAYLNHCRKNLRTWEQRKIELQKCPQTQPPTSLPTDPQPDENEGGIYIRSKPSRSILCPPPSAPASLSICSTSNDLSSSFSLQSPSTLSSRSFASSSEGSFLPPTPRVQSGSFMTAFPLTLPAYPPKRLLASDSGSTWTHATSPSTESSRCASEHGEDLDSPVAGKATELPPLSTSQSQSRSTILAPEASSSLPSQHDPRRRQSNSSLASGNSSNSSTVEASARPSGSSSDGNILFTQHHSAESSQTNSDGALIVDDELELNPIHAAIRNASRVGVLRQQRQKRAVRYSWCAGMAGLTGGTGLMAAFQQYHEAQSQEQHDPTSQLSRISSEASSTDLSPAIPPSPAPASLNASSTFVDEAAMASNSRLNDEPSSSQPQPHDPSHNTTTPRLSPSISSSSLQVRSPS